MQTAVVPDRFLAFAFGAGDILIELDSHLNIVSLDGAQGLIDPGGRANLVGTDFRSLLRGGSREDFSPIVALKDKESFRFGPMSMSIGTSEDASRRFCVFASKVLGNDRIFLTISLESRFGSASRPTEVSKATDAQDFLERVDKLLENNDGLLSDLQMTIVEAESFDAGQEATQAILNSLSRYSTNGTPASEIRPGQFAVMHSNDPQAPDTQTILNDVEQNTGLTMNGVTLDPAQDNAPDPALFLHTLRDIVNSDERFSLVEMSAVYQESLQANFERAEQFKRVLRQGSFSLAFQPIVSLADRQVHHYEALTRFNQNIGFDNAFDTIKFAEQTGVIAEFDLQVIWRVFRELEQAQDNKDVLQLAVNVSGNSLNKADFLDQLIKTLSRHKKKAKVFQLEITESFQIYDLDALAEVIRDIQGLGFSVCLDDFGAGASGFQYLRTLPVDCVKIDGPYVRDAMEDVKARAFLKAMIGLCRELHIQTVAEWIENEDQHACLKEMGADYGQGFLYGPAADLPSSTTSQQIFRDKR